MFAAYLHKIAGNSLFPCVRPGKDHAHMAPALINHLRANDFENKPDFLNRRSAMFYKNPAR